MATSMVKGNPVKLMLSFAFPLLIGNLLQQTYNIIDAAIVGQALGPEVRFLALMRLQVLGRAAVYSFWCSASVWEAARDSVFRLQSISVPESLIKCAIIFLMVLHLLS